jgi:hypothetical protein
MPTGQMLQGAILTKTTGLTVEILQSLPDHGLKGVTLPEMDMTGYMPTGNMLRSANAAPAAGILAAAIAAASLSCCCCNINSAGVFVDPNPTGSLASWRFFISLKKSSICRPFETFSFRTSCVEKGKSTEGDEDKK